MAIRSTITIMVRKLPVRDASGAVWVILKLPTKQHRKLRLEKFAFAVSGMKGKPDFSEELLWMNED